MKYHILFFSKIRKDVANLSSAAVVIGALRVVYEICCKQSMQNGLMDEWKTNQKQYEPDM